MASYDATVLADSPAYFWEMNDSSGTAAPDSADANAGIYQPTVTLGQTGIGDTEGAVLFNGSTGYVSTATSITNPSVFSLECWFKVANAYATGGPLITFASGATGAAGSFDRVLWMDNSGLVHFASVANQVASSTGAFNDGNWHHIVATFDTTNGSKLYVDGALAGSNATTTTNNYSGFWRIANIGGAFAAGSFTPAPTNTFIAATLAKAAVYPTVLTLAKIQAHFNARNNAPPAPAQRAYYDRPRHQVIVGDKDVTERCDSITYSATDTGGFEIATLGLPAVDRPKKGAAITIRSGLEVAWAGRVAEIADHSQHGRATKTTGCEGWRALMRDSPFPMIYVDRDLTKWAAPSNTRQIALLNATQRLGDSIVSPDAVNGLPALVQHIRDDWVSPNVPLCEAWYDAGAANLIAAIYYNNLPYVGLGAGWSVLLALSVDDTLSSTQFVAPAVNGASGYLQPATPQRYGVARFAFATAPGGAAGNDVGMSWRNMAVYGNHGLTRRGADPGGFWPSDIARHALSQCKGIATGTIVDSTGLVAPHVTYPTATAADVIVDDMAKLMGWTWGVWEPPTVFDSQPRMDFRPPPTDATCVVTKAECDQLDITSRIGDLYNTALITYTDPAGKVGLQTVTLANAQLSEAGIVSRPLILNMGPGSAAAAATFGSFALALSQVAARGAGQATLPVSVRLPGGGSKPSHLLRPGIDRLRIVDLVDGGPLLDIGTSRRDVFRISRTETTVAKDGTPSTRVELDTGSNLLETLQARVALAAGVVGSGASGG